MSDLAKVLVLDNEVEARLLSSLLDEADIPHVLQSYHDTAYDGIWQAQRGWGQISAPHEFAVQIRDIHAHMGEE